ncbi:MAG TPA: hypothetical protein VE967_02705 [Gemmatimonadaceae bacterium]|nr:hypothetical protein [Gemmatimonadaceae bacterium]
MRIVHGVLLGTAVASAAHAQSKIPIREIGRLERTTTDSLRSVTEALHMAGGRVLVNDAWAKRVLLLDSTLAHPIIVADTTSATANAYGMHRGGTIMRYRGDSALYIDQASLTMFLVPPSGVLGRVMAFPPPPVKESGGQLITGGESGPPGFDAKGRLVYVNEGSAPPGSMMLLGSSRPGDPSKPPTVSPNMYADSTFAFRVDLATRKTDTIASLKMAGGILRVRRAEGNVTAIENSFDPLPVIDQWAMLPDGTFAVVRGRDYHVDWLGSDGVWTSTPKMDFEWQRVTDGRKTQLRDSVEAAMRDQFARNERLTPTPPPGGGGGRGGGRGGGGGDAPVVGLRKPVPNVVIPMPLDQIADYVPPFTAGAVRADAEGNIWIRTSTMKGDRPIYDVVSRTGAVIDRVQLPANRVIAGFGPGVIYMAVMASSSIARLERARIH